MDERQIKYIWQFVVAQEKHFAYFKNSPRRSGVFHMAA